MTNVWRSPRLSVSIDLVERGGGRLGVAGGAHRQGVAVRSESGGGGEVQLRAGGVDQVVVGQLLTLRRPLGSV